jgi:hypothetical protein
MKQFLSVCFVEGEFHASYYPAHSPFKKSVWYFERFGFTNFSLKAIDNTLLLGID